MGRNGENIENCTGYDAMRILQLLLFFGRDMVLGCKNRFYKIMFSKKIIYEINILKLALRKASRLWVKEVLNNSCENEAYFEEKVLLC